MADKKIKIGLYGAGSLKSMFLSTAQEVMIDAVFYERSARFLAFRKREIELGKTKYVDPKTAVRDLPLERMDLRIHFEQTEFSEADIKTKVTVVHPAAKRQRVLHLSVKQDNINKDNFEEVFRSHSLRIVNIARCLIIKPKTSNQSGAGRLSATVRTGPGRIGCKIRGPLGLK